MSNRKPLSTLGLVALSAFIASGALRPADTADAQQQEEAMFAGNFERNMISDATNLPAIIPRRS